MFLNTAKRVEKYAGSGVFLMNLEVSENAMDHLKCLIYLSILIKI